MTSKSLGFWSLIALVIGNMVGSGAYLLPASLATYGTIGLVAWLGTTVAAICLALLFSRLARQIPKVGGPYAYCYEAYGEAIGFQVAFNYWIAIWAGNAAIIVALVGYLSFFWPVLHTSHLATLIASVIFLWFFTLINLLHVKLAGVVQIITTILKMVPLIFIALIGLFYIHPHNLASFNISHTSNFHALIASAALTFWSFIGLESATVPAEDTINPEKNVPRATILGTIIAAFVYILGTLAIMGIVPMTELAGSSSPYALASKEILGNWAGYLIAIAAIIATAGTLNGWILLQGQIPYAAAKDGLFPRAFARLSRTGTPWFGLILSSFLVTLLLIMSADQGLVSQFTVIILLATLANVVPYLYTAFAEMILWHKKPDMQVKRKGSTILIACLAFILMALAIMGIGKDVIYWWMILLMISIPFYAWMKSSNKSKM
jgi:basic amino acid/polyamine antiporter, APA family